VEGSGDDLLEG